MELKWVNPALEYGENDNGYCFLSHYESIN